MTVIMKRLGVFISVLLFIICICSCKSSVTEDPFSVFYGNITAKVRLTFGESSSVFTYRRENGTETVTFSEPTALNGYVFTKKDDRITLSYDDLTAEVSASVGRVAFVSSDIFSPNADDISSVSALEHDGGYITEVVCGGIVYRFLHDGTPLSVKGTARGTTFEAEIYQIGRAL